MRNKKGIALIMAVGILALLAVIATSFALNMRLEYKAAMNYYNGVRARYLAEAALQRAIAELKTHVKESAFDSLDEPWASGYSDSVSSTATSTIVDMQRWVNVNKASERLLKNLISERLPAYNSSEVGALYTNVISRRDYNHLNELLSKPPIENQLTQAEFDAIEPYLTVHSYIDPNASDHSPININTCDSVVLKWVIRGLSDDGTTTISGDSKINAVITAITNARPITSWAQFDDIFDDPDNGLVSTNVVDSAEATLIKDNCNPNRSKPSTYTTEFCFHSGGVYEITGTGTVTDSTGSTIATRTVTAVVKIYGIYTETTEGDFENPDNNGGAYERVTWLDSCPVDSSELFGNYSASLSTAKKISGSIKLGFWDDFSDSDYTTSAWSSDGGTCTITLSERLNLNNWGKYVITDPAYTNFGQFSLRIFEDFVNQGGLRMRNVGWILFWGATSAGDSHHITPGNSICALHAQDGTLEWNSQYAYDDPALPENEVKIMAINIAKDYFGVENDVPLRHPYDAQVRIFEKEGDDPCHDTSDYQTPLSHTQTKVHNIIAGNDSEKDDATLTIYTSASNPSLTRTGMSNKSGVSYGKIGLYGDVCQVEWDDIRIISSDGNYTSQIIDSSVIPDLPADFVWGTIAGTISQSTTDTDKQGDIIIQTSETGGMSDVYGDIASDAIDENKLYLNVSLKADNPSLAIGTKSSSIQYKTWLTNGDSELKETPVLEDITITYLPKVKILAWKVE